MADATITIMVIIDETQNAKGIPLVKAIYCGSG
jgi:hypothetical protein